MTAGLVTGTDDAEQRGPYGLSAASYLAAGWQPIPLPPRSKYPPPEGFTGYGGRIVGEADVAAWCNGAHFAGGQPVRLGNVALRLPDDIGGRAVVGIDVDHYLKGGRRKLGATALADVEARLGPLPKTVRSSARGADNPGGIRLYRAPAGRRWRSTVTLHVEVIHHGNRYAVVWPSLNPEADGALYRWYDDDGLLLPEGWLPDPTALPELPPEWSAWLVTDGADDSGRRSRSSSGGPGPGVDRAARADEAAGRALLAAMPEGDGDPCDYILELLDELQAALGPGSHHIPALNITGRIVRAGEMGHHGARTALETAEGLWFASKGRWKPSTAKEFHDMVLGMARKVAADPTPEDRLGCCGEHSRFALTEFTVVDEAAVGVEVEAVEVAGEAASTAPGPVALVGSEHRNTDRPGGLSLVETLEFFDALPVLQQALVYAQARRASPWATLGVVLVRGIACLSPTIKLPGVIGVPASINTFLALCGPVGQGKSVAMGVGAEFLRPIGGVKFYVTEPSTDAGLLGAYGSPHTDHGVTTFRQIRPSVLFQMDEIETLSASFKGQHGTRLSAFLRTAYMGGLLSPEHATRNAQRRLEAHEYRMCVIAGVQAANAGVLLDGADGGLPQRWLWLPTFDPDRPKRGTYATDAEPYEWMAPSPVVEYDEQAGVVVWPDEQIIGLPQVAVEAMLDANDAAQRPLGKPSRAADLEGHALLNRAHIAAGLAALSTFVGRIQPVGGSLVAVTVSETVWELAGVVQRVSDHTRAAVIAERAANDRGKRDRQADQAGRSAAITGTVAAAQRVDMCAGVLKRALEKPTRRGGEFAARDLRDLAPQYTKEERKAAAEGLVRAGLWTAEDRSTGNRNKQETRYYRRAGGGA